MDRIGIIVAVSSPPGRSRRGLVRASGAGALELLDAMLTAPWSAAAPAGRPRGVARVRLRVPAPGIAALALRFPGPGSATGEDTFELLLPGNPNLLELVIQSMLALDARTRRAGPGEFSARAFLNGRLSLDAAEGVAALIRATSDAELEAAARLADGAVGRDARRWADRIAECAALVEAGIDFTDEEDVTAIAPEALAGAIGGVADEIEASGGGGASSRSRESPPRVVLLGAPNAGKSTLFNALLGRRRTVASPRAGTTRDAIEATWSLAAPGGAMEVLLVDLPGVDPRPGAAEGAGGSAAASPPSGDLVGPLHRAAERAVGEADLVLLCRAADEDHVAAARVEPAARLAGARPTIVVRTKSDLATARGRAPGAAIWTSAATGSGLDALRAAVAAALGSGAGAQAGAMAVLPRHRAALDRAGAALREAVRAAQREPPRGPWRRPEETAALLRLAIDALGEITGALHADDLLEIVFSRFCIGK